jgi:hypothetical protein
LQKSETESSNGWWETSTGAEFGKSIIAKIEALKEVK